MGASTPSATGKGKMSGDKMTRARVAFALLCGLAVCCSVMYITADAGDNVEGESVLAPAKSAYGIGGPTSVDFTNVEKEIAAEEAARKRDVAAVRAQMDRTFAFNQAARKKLKKALLHKMAVNAKKAKD